MDKIGIMNAAVKDSSEGVGSLNKVIEFSIRICKLINLLKNIISNDILRKRIF